MLAGMGGGGTVMLVKRGQGADVVVPGRNAVGIPRFAKQTVGAGADGWWGGGGVYVITVPYFAVRQTGHEIAARIAQAP